MVSGSCVMYLTSTVASGLMYWAPAVKPASNFLMRSISTPPMKPSLPEGEAQAAAAPARNEPSCSAKTIERTFGSGCGGSVLGTLTTESMIAYF